MSYRLRSKPHLRNKAIITIVCRAFRCRCKISHFNISRHFKLAGSEQYERYQRFAAEEFVLRSGGVLCPQPGCGMGIMPESAVVTEAGSSNSGNRRIACAGPQGCGYVFCRDCLQVSELSDENMYVYISQICNSTLKYVTA